MLAPRRLALSLSLSLLLAAPLAHADEGNGGGTPNALVINPGDLFNGVISIEYERALNSFFGITLGASIGLFKGVFAPPAGAYYTAGGPELGVRFHFIRDAPGGLWLGPSVNLYYVAGRAFGYGIGAAIGYNFVIGRHFLLQLGIGGGFNDYGDGIQWSPRLRLGIGGVF